MIQNTEEILDLLISGISPMEEVQSIGISGGKTPLPKAGERVHVTEKLVYVSGLLFSLLSDPLVGIPCPMLIQQPDRYYHTDQDSLDKLDPIILRDVTVAAAVYLYTLAMADSAMLKEMLRLSEVPAKLNFSENRDELEVELAKVVPVRKYWGFSTLSQRRHHLPKERLTEIWRVAEKDAHYAAVLAQYWVDGKRNLLEIADLVEMETGQRELEFIRDLFYLLREVGSLDFVD